MTKTKARKGSTTEPAAKAATGKKQRTPAAKKTPLEQVRAVLSGMLKDAPALARWTQTALDSWLEIPPASLRLKLAEAVEMMHNIETSSAAALRILDLAPMKTIALPVFVRVGGRSRLSVGDFVKVKLDKLKLYTKHGMFRPADLMLLRIKKIAGKEALVNIMHPTPMGPGSHSGPPEPGTEDIHIRSLSHLEPLPAPAA